MSNTQDHPDIEQLPLAVEGVPVRETVRELFRNPENGTPDNISKAGCWALALKSNEISHDFFELNGHTQGNTQHTAIVWNCWRQTFPVEGSFEDPVNHANFEGASFEGLGLSFAGFQFGDFANFEATRWGDNANFRDAQWGDTANFVCAAWGHQADFRNCQWGSVAFFDDAQWGNSCDMSGARWGRFSSFDGARWGRYADLTACQWDRDASFNGAVWGYGASFKGAQWAGYVVFSYACFLGNVDFSATSWGEIKRFYGAHFENAQTWAEENNTGPNQFPEVIFKGVWFGGIASFANRRFCKSTNFNRVHADTSKPIRIYNNGPEFDDDDALAQATKKQDGAVHFLDAPLFHGCELHQDTSFDGATFPKAAGNDEAARAYRTLKLAFSKQQAIREEQRFFRLEMGEEAQRETGLKRWLFRAYGLFSNYGFSIGKPLVVLVVCAIVLGPVHTDAPQWCAPLGSTGKCDLWQPSVWAHGFWYGTPLGGIHPTEAHVPALQMLGIVLHKTISLAALFLVGLALRNLFKLK